MDKLVQTRSEETGLCYFDTVQKALDAAKKNNTIWKISFTLSDERLRLVRHMNPNNETIWVLEGTQGAMSEETQKYIQQKESPNVEKIVDNLNNGLVGEDEHNYLTGKYDVALTRDEQDNAERLINADFKKICDKSKGDV